MHLLITFEKITMRYLLLLSIFLTSCSVSEPSKDFSMDIIAPDKVTVAFYNVENLFDIEDDPKKNDNDFTPEGYKNWTSERYFEKLSNISKVFNAMNKSDWPIIVGLAEVENATVLEALTKEKDLIDGNYEFVHFDSPDNRGIDVALMYRPEFFHVLEKKSFNIFNTDFPNSKTRDILYVKGEFYNGEVFHFYVNHWSSRRNGILETEPKRVFQASVLKKNLDKVLTNEPNAKIVIMGDFNDFPTDKSITKILGAGTSNKGLYNLAYALHMQDKGTMSYKNDWGMFDQFIVSQSIFAKGLHVNKKQQTILDEEWLVWKGKKPNRTYGGQKYYGGFSDHLPIYIDLVE
jgi:predicted extracellular nuclease